jgi:hypothetical protein
MKAYLAGAIIAASFMISISGCKKTASPTEDIIISDTVKQDYIYPDPVVSSTGVLAAKVMPETKFSVLLYNDSDSYEEYSIADRTGIFVVNKVKAGEYTLVIQPADPAYNAIQLDRIRIDTGRTTNLGLIFLP